MSQESETVLRNSLDLVDRFRTRVIATITMVFVLTVLALGSLMAGAASRAGSNVAATKMLFASVAWQMLFIAVCTGVVAFYITRMTKTILRAIELMTREPPH
jgi:hypothetical protein